MQAKILEEAGKLVKPGGAVIYSTCSIEKEENKMQVDQFLDENPEFDLEEERRLLPCALHDGGYSALLRRTK